LTEAYITATWLGAGLCCMLFPVFTLRASSFLEE